MILSVALSVMLFGAMIGFYHYAAQVRDESVKQIERVQTRRALMDHISSTLRTARQQVPVAIEGQPDSIKFLATRFPSPAAWNEYTMTEKPPPPSADLALVTFRLATEEAEDGQKTITGIEMGVQKLLTQTVIIDEGAPAPETPPGEEEAPPELEIDWFLLTSEYRYLRFGYFNGSQITETWGEGGAGGLPVAVEVVIGREPLEEGVDPAEHEKTHEVHRRQIYIYGSGRVPITLPPEDDGGET